MPPYETDFLVPSATFLLALALFAVGLVGLVLVPVVQAARRERVAWVLVIVLIAPIGGVLWFTFGRRDANRSDQRLLSSTPAASDRLEA